MGYYFLAVGCVITGIAAWGTFSHLMLFVRGTRVRGRIVGIDEQMRFSQSNRKKVFFHPIIAFETPEGHSHEFTHGGGSTYSRPKIGKEVSVVYQNPQHARLNSFMGMWAGPIAAWILGLGVLYAATRLFFDSPDS